MVFGSIPDNSNIQDFFFYPGLKEFSTIMQLKSSGSDKRYYSITVNFMIIIKTLVELLQRFGATFSGIDVQSCQTEHPTFLLFCINDSK